MFLDTNFFYSSVQSAECPGLAVVKHIIGFWEEELDIWHRTIISDFMDLFLLLKVL